MQISNNRSSSLILNKHINYHHLLMVFIYYIIVVISYIIYTYMLILLHYKFDCSIRHHNFEWNITILNKEKSYRCRVIRILRLKFFSVLYENGDEYLKNYRRVNEKTSSLNSVNISVSL